MSATDNNRKLEMSRLLMVSGVNRPAIPGQVDTPTARIDHRLDANHQSLGKPCPVALTSVIRNAWSLVHLLPKPVALKLTDN